MSFYISLKAFKGIVICDKAFSTGAKAENNENIYYAKINYAKHIFTHSN